MSKIYDEFVARLGRDVVPGLYDYVDNNYTFLIDIPSELATRLRSSFYLSSDEEILMFRSKWKTKGFGIEAFIQSFNSLAGVLLTNKRYIRKFDVDTKEEDMVDLDWYVLDHFSCKDRVVYTHFSSGTQIEEGDILCSYFRSFSLRTESEINEFDEKGYGTLFCDTLNSIIKIADSESPDKVYYKLINEQKFDEAKSHMLSTINSAKLIYNKWFYQYLYASCFYEESKTLCCDNDEPEEQRIKKEYLLKEAVNVCRSLLREFEREIKVNENLVQSILWLRGQVSYLLIQCVNSDPSIRNDVGWTFVDERNHLFYVLENKAQVNDAHRMLNGELSFRELLKKEGAEENEYKSLGEVLEYADRNVMLFVKNEAELAGMVDNEGNIPLVCTLKDYPRSIHLPIGHPKANTLYFAHPVNSDVYLPFETAYDVLFVEMVKEFCYLCQCLGATEIKFVMTKGSSSNGQSAILNKLELEVGRKALGVKGSSDENILEQNASETKREHEITYTYEPTSNPYVPNDLVWLKNNEEWNNLVRQRTNGGNLLSYTERISSHDSSNMSSSHNRQLKASFSNLISKVDPSYERNVEQTFSNIEEKEIVISVNFKSVDQLQKVNREVLEVEAPIVEASIVETGEHSDAEKAFIDEIKFAIEEDGAITSLHKVFLEQVRSKFGLSKEVADTLIAEYSDPYTENEKEYMKAVSEYIVDGAIAEGSDRLLVRFARLLDISAERALELQSKCLNENNG